MLVLGRAVSRAHRHGREIPRGREAHEKRFPRNCRRAPSPGARPRGSAGGPVPAHGRLGRQSPGRCPRSADGKRRMAPDVPASCQGSRVRGCDRRLRPGPGRLCGRAVRATVQTRRRPSSSGQRRLWPRRIAASRPWSPGFRSWRSGELADRRCLRWPTSSSAKPRRSGVS